MRGTTCLLAFLLLFFIYLRSGTANNFNKDSSRLICSAWKETVPFYHVDINPLTFDDANMYCQSLGMKLAESRMKEQEVQLRRQTVNATDDIWIGLRATSTPLNAASSYSWLTQPTKLDPGQQTDSKNGSWCSGQPTSDGACVSLRMNCSWKWNNMNCNLTKSFACQCAGSVFSTTPTQSTTTTTTTTPAATTRQATTSAASPASTASGTQQVTTSPKTSQTQRTDTTVKVVQTSSVQSKTTQVTTQVLESVSTATIMQSAVSASSTSSSNQSTVSAFSTSSSTQTAVNAFSTSSSTQSTAVSASSTSSSTQSTASAFSTSPSQSDTSTSRSGSTSQGSASTTLITLQAPTTASVLATTQSGAPSTARQAQTTSHVGTVSHERTTSLGTHGVGSQTSITSTNGLEPLPPDATTASRWMGTTGQVVPTNATLPASLVRGSTINLMGIGNTVVANVTTQAPVRYVPGQLATSVYQDSALLGLTSTSSFTLVPKTIDVLYNLTRTSVPAGRNRLTKQIVLKTWLDITPPANVTTSVRYTIFINERTVDPADITNPAAYGSAEAGSVRLLSAGVRCKFVDPATGALSDFGLRTVEKRDGSYACFSNHTTIFAALLSVTVVFVPLGVSTISYVVESISVVSLLVTMAILIRLRKKLRSDRTFVQISLCGALLLLHVVNLIHDLALPVDAFCEFVAVMTHLAVLSTVCWMLVEGITLMIKTSDRALRSDGSRKLRIGKMVFGFSLPALIVACAAIPGFLNNTYMALNPGAVSRLPGVNTYQTCWLSNSSGVLVGAVMVPVAIALAVNVCILVRVGVLVYHKSKKAKNFRPMAAGANGGVGKSAVPDDFEHAKASARAVFLLCPVLGVPWCLFFIAGTEKGLMYTSAILNGLQGLFLFLVYCVFNKEVMRSMARIWRRTELARKLSSARRRMKDSDPSPSTASSVAMAKISSNSPSSF